jgi:hypothetical protein
MQTLVEFDRFWNASFSHMPPIAWHMREENMLKWVRFYSLPGGKRYPSSRGERLVALRRYNSIADEVFLDDVDCWIVAAYPIYDGIPQYNIDVILSEGFDLFKNIDFISDDGDLEVQRIFVKSGTWKSGKFNKIFNLIMDGKLPSLMFVSKARLSIYAPYDGGIDVILQAADAFQEMLQKYEEWLSDREDGL